MTDVPVQYTTPDGTHQVSCPKCGRPMTGASGGALCLACGYVITHTSEPGPRILPPVAPVEIPVIRRAPYSSARQAMQALVLARMLSESARSITGRQCEAMALGLSPRGYTPAQSIPAVLDPIGDLAAAADRLLPEDRLLLELENLTPEWVDMARRCGKCGHVYMASGRRCVKCNHKRNVDEIRCRHEGCDESRATLVFDPCTYTMPDGKPCGANNWRWTPGKGALLAAAVSARRMDVWRRQVKNRQPERSEIRETVYCPACDLLRLPLYEHGQWHHARECPECGGHVRQMLEVEELKIGGLIAGAIARWKRILRGRGLIP